MNAILTKVYENMYLVSVILFSALIYMGALVFNFEPIMASSHADNGIMPYYAILSNLKNFHDDPHAIFAQVATRASIMFSIPIWVAMNFAIPIKISCLVIQFVQVFALPIMFSILFVRTGMRKWAFAVFFATMLSGLYCWNLANYGIEDIPMPHQFAVPLLCLGMYWLIHRQYVIGTLILVLGVYIHMWMGIYAFATLLVYVMYDFRKINISVLVSFVSILVSIGVFFLLNYDPKYATLSSSDIIPLIRYGMHDVPWEYPPRWHDSWQSLAAYTVLALLAVREWGAFGDAYKRLIYCTIAVSVVFSLMHIAGVYFEIPVLVQSKGLRAPFIAVIATFPAVIRYLCSLMDEKMLTSRVLAALTILLMIFGSNYGVNKYTVSGLVVMRITAERESMLYISKVLWMRLILYITIAWTAIWGITALGKLYRSLTHSLITNVFDTISSISIDTNMTIFIIFTGIIMIALTSIRSNNVNNKMSNNISAVIMLVLCLLCLAKESIALSIKYSGDPCDLYGAQQWAKMNTAPDALFIVRNNSWRSFSERPALPMLPKFIYVYVNDSRLKEYPDKLIRFYELEGFTTRLKNQMEMYHALNKAYDDLGENRIIEFARQFGATYIVEKKNMNFPVVYFNKTYKIYKIS